MVLGLARQAKHDAYLTQTVHTDRFDLVNGTWRDAVRLTLPWANDPETLHVLMYAKSRYSKLEWISRLARPDGRSVFYHAIVPRDGKEAIGVHRIRLDRSGSASVGIALNSKDWWGKGVFEEVRQALMDHFSQSPRVVRFSGRVLARNFSSVYNYKKLGFRLIGHDRNAWLSPWTGELNDTMFFEYLAEDWRAKRQLGLK